MTPADSALGAEKVADAEDAAIYEWCAPGQHYSGEAILCHIIESGSGPGHSQYACPTHMQARGWTSLADKLSRT